MYHIPAKLTEIHALMKKLYYVSNVTTPYIGMPGMAEGSQVIVSPYQWREVNLETDTLRY